MATGQVLYYSGGTVQTVPIQRVQREASAFHPPDFNYAFWQFLTNFTVNGDATYRNQVRELDLFGLQNLAHVGSSDAPGVSILGNNTLIVPTLRIDLDHFNVPVWFSNTGNVDDSVSQTDGESTTVGGTAKWGEILTQGFKSHPMRAVECAERVVRRLYIDLLSGTQRRALQQLLIDDQDPQAGFDGRDAPAEAAGIYDDFGQSDDFADVQGGPERRRLLQAIETRGLGLVQLELVDRTRDLKISELCADLLERMIVVTGIVVQASRPRHKPVRVRLRCRGCRAEMTLRVPSWRAAVELPRLCPSGSSSPDQKCPPDPFVILNDRSVFLDVQHIKLQELPEKVLTGVMPKRLTVDAVGVFCGKVTPGDRVRITGVFTAANKDRNVDERNRGGDSQPYLHVVGASLINNDGGGGSRRLKAWGFEKEEEFRLLARQPDILKRIFASIAPAIIGMPDIKMSIACLLFGGARKQLPDGTRVRGDMNVLLLGDPSTAKSQFLKFAERVAPIAVFTSGKGSSAAGLTAAVVRDGNGNFALEGGAMVLADLGVVCIDEFDKMRDADRVAIHEAMEQQTISLSKAGITTILNTRCSVLAAANPSFGSYDPTRDTTDQHDFETTILSRFDLIWIVRDQRNVEQDQKIAKHIFNLHLGAKGHGTSGNQADDIHSADIIPQELLKQYIHYCRNICDPVLSESAAKRLENYYVEVRTGARGDNRRMRDQVPITVRQLESLARTSEALAKMTLSQFVTEDHVNEAIRLFKLSTVEAAKGNAKTLDRLSDQDRALVKAAENLILARLPLFGRTSKNVILRELQTRAINASIAGFALKALIARNLLEERGDATVKRIQ